MPRPRNVFTDFTNSKGLNTVADPLQLSPQERQTCKDIDIDKNGREWRRASGSVLKLAGNYQNGWSNGKICLATIGTSLVRLADAMTSVQTVLRTNIGYGKMVYDDCAGTGIIYYTNGVVIGFIKDGVSYTLDSTTVPDRVDTSPGHLICYAFNRLWIAVDNVIYFTDPSPIFYFNRINKAENFIQRKGIITLMKPVEDGIFIADGSTWFMSGHNPKAPGAMQFVCDYNAIPYMVTQNPIDAEILSEDGAITSGKMIFWGSEKGIRYGMKGGISGNLTRKRYKMPATPLKGVCLHMNREDGFNQLINIIQN